MHTHTQAPTLTTHTMRKKMGNDNEVLKSQTNSHGFLGIKRFNKWKNSENRFIYQTDVLTVPQLNNIKRI